MLGFLFKTKAPTHMPANEDPPRSDLAFVRQAKDADYTDVEALADQLGIEIRRPSFSTEIAGCLTCLGGKWSIGVNPTADKNRQRFTIAHEIAHYLLHRDLILKNGEMSGVYDSNKYRQPMVALLNPYIEIKHEQQANRIAADILMCGDKMRRLSASGMSIFQIADHIGCSVGATKVRLGMLELPLDGR